MTPKHPPTLVLLLAAAFALGGCRSNHVAIEEGPLYPDWLLPAAQTLDIQVVRQGEHIELTNTTARHFGPSVLWLNGWFGRPIEGLEVGQTLRLPLNEFRDRFSEAFRGGGFFATEKPDDLVLAELQIGETLYGLIVVGGKGE